MTNTIQTEKAAVESVRVGKCRRCERTDVPCHSDGTLVRHNIPSGTACLTPGGYWPRNDKPAKR